MTPLRGGTPLLEYRFGKLTGRSFASAKEFMTYIKQLKQQREDRKQPQYRDKEEQ